ncbi:MAG: hypothetical protein HYR55_20790 [Acidobacteria bacterium]|nr:hypothetical protein [Acidobacteriota bacterium]MBI3657926.1 hypothetical protein [Acidobacteriota bacterium]
MHDAALWADAVVANLYGPLWSFLIVAGIVSEDGISSRVVVVSRAVKYSTAAVENLPPRTSFTKGPGSIVGMIGRVATLFLDVLFVEECSRGYTHDLHLHAVQRGWQDRIK